MTKVIAKSVDRIWADMSMKDNDKVGFEESKHILRELMSSQIDDRFSDDAMKKLFKNIDRDGDEKLTKGEITQFIMNLSKF